MHAGLVAGGGVVRDPGADGGLDGGGQRPVLEERLIEEAEIVDDDVRACRGEAAHRIFEGQLAVAAAREEEARARRQVVDDLEERRALVATAPRTPRVGGDGDGRQVARRLRLRDMVDAV